MATTFPTSLQDLDGSRGTDNDPLSAPNHATHHNTEDDTIEALQAKVGIDGSAVQTSHDYKLSGVTGSDVAAGIAATQTLTNKTIDGDNNTVTDIDASTSLKTGTAVPIANGGTGATAQTDGFDALAPTTTKGDVIVNNGTDNIRVAVGNNNEVLTADSAEASGVKWASVSTKFGGDGSDGALSISSGATNIDLSNEPVVVRNYTSISITGTGQLTFTNPATNGTIVILKSTGNVTITSSTTPCIDASGLGASSDQNGMTVSGSFAATGGVGADHQSGGLPGGVGGTASSGVSSVDEVFEAALEGKLVLLAAGAGGATGGEGGEGSSGTGGLGSSGGRGGGGLYIECGGAWNFTTTSGISVAGDDGSAGGTGSGTGHGGGGGGGGGAGGSCFVLYNSLTANTGTITIAGGTGGAGAAGANQSGGAGGAGGNGVAGDSNGGEGGEGGSSGDTTNGGAGGGGAGGASVHGGTNGTDGTNGTGGTGGAGGAGGGGGASGYSLVAENNYFT
jgi:hypothetical protein